MSEPVAISWKEMFQTGTRMDTTLRLREIKRWGHPFLLLPQSAPLAAQALLLYPAQTRFAHLARAAFHTCLRLRLPLPLPVTAVSFGSADPFPQFLARCADGDAFPRLAIFCGNARGAGRRFILLLFNDAGQPACVVKAGNCDAAVRLIRAESQFLQSIPAGIPGLPTFRLAFASGMMAAFAMDFIAGAGPTREDRDVIAPLLTGWLDQSREIRVEEIPAWKALAQTHSDDPRFQSLAGKLAGHTFLPALFHGDFAPWNIRVAADGAWHVFDWERGEHVGFPGWDWFHYVAQTGILVEKNSAPVVAQKLGQLIDSGPFQQYAQAAGIQRLARPLAAAYLLHFVETVAPGEGLKTNRELLSILAGGWSDK